MKRFLPFLLGSLFACCFFFVSHSAMAQAKLTIPVHVNVGDKITIGYSGGAPNTDITVTIDTGGFPQRNVDKVIIHLDDTGAGTGSYTIPNSPGLAFNAPGALEVDRIPGF